VDISTRNADTLLGDEWLRFLLGCRITVGAEGGASLLDRDGSIRERTGRYLAANPAATFEEIESASFPGLDGNLPLRALSPRHLEACVTRTAQILVEGEYGGVLRPQRHYLPLKRDFSNIDELLRQAEDASVLDRLTEAAYQDIVASGRFHYRTLVRQVMSQALDRGAPSSDRFTSRFALAYLRVSDLLTWRYLRLRRMVRGPARVIISNLRRRELRQRSGR
jgi:hypothetical protein